jgi:hypothetical protein
MTIEHSGSDNISRAWLALVENGSRTSGKLTLDLERLAIVPGYLVR